MQSNQKLRDCIRAMHVEMHPDLFNAYCCTTLENEVSSAGAILDVVDAVWDPALILFTRKERPVLTNGNGDVFLTPSKVSCDRALYVRNADDIAQQVCNNTLTKHVNEVKNVVDKKLTLVVYGVKDHYKGKTTGRRTQNSNKIQMSEIELELAITDLLVSVDCDTVIVNTPTELSLLVVQFTKAIAEEPFKRAKRECDEQAEFYMRGENKQSVAIDKDGNGMNRLWQQMVAVLPSSSLETSRAVCEKYKTPKALYEALQKPSTVNELADIGVARSAVPGAKLRRLGPEFARRLQILFTADNGDVVVE